MLNAFALSNDSTMQPSYYNSLLARDNTSMLATEHYNTLSSNYVPTTTQPQLKIKRHVTGKTKTST